MCVCGGGGGGGASRACNHASRVFYGLLEGERAARMRRLTHGLVQIPTITVPVK